MVATLSQSKMLKFSLIDGQSWEYSYDELGQVISGVKKTAAGTVVATYDYDPSGNVAATGSVSSNPWQFSSEFRDIETGLIYYNYRYYAPGIGRWINRDPIWELGSINLLNYVFNNSIGNSDSFGLCTGGEKRNIQPVTMITAGNAAAIEVFSPQELEDWEKIMNIIEESIDIVSAAAEGPFAVIKELSQKIIEKIGKKAFHKIQKRLVELGQAIAGSNYRIYTKITYEECTSFLWCSYWKRKQTSWRECVLEDNSGSSAYGIYQDFTVAVKDKSACEGKHLDAFYLGDTK